jgi:L-threonylcarbamoyladenylate synthase
VTEEIPVILRPGHITKRKLEEVIGEVRMDPGLSETNADSRPKAPGMKYRHYAPKAKMTVYEGSQKAVTDAIRKAAMQYPEERVGILAAEETACEYPHGRVVAAGSRKKNTVGQGLYGALREFDHLGVEVILSESFSDEESSEAIMNRLLKAAGHNILYLSGE